MTNDTSTKRILIVGNKTSQEKTHPGAYTDSIIELVNTFDEALDKYSCRGFDRIIIDPALLVNSDVTLLNMLGAALCFKDAAGVSNALLFPLNTGLDAQTAIAHMDANYNFIWANSLFKMLFGITPSGSKEPNYFDRHSGSKDITIFECVKRSGTPLRISTPISQLNENLICKVAPLRSASTTLHGFVISITKETYGKEHPHRPISVKTDSGIDREVRSRETNATNEQLQAIIEELRVEIEERRRVEEELSQARSMAERRAIEIESFISGMPDGVALFDAEGRVRLINSAGQHMLGIEPGMAYADWSKAIRRYTIDGHEPPVEHLPLSKALAGETVTDERYKLVAASGRQFIAGISAAPVRGCKERVIGATLVFRDISELVAFEDQRREVYEREHRIAEILQQALIPPQVNYKIERCKIVVKYQPALHEAAVGGDFYDIFDVGDGKVGIVIGDIAGKGLPAAIRVAAARYSIRSYAFLDPSPSVVLTLANQALCREEMDEIGLLTAFFAVMDVQTGTMTYSNGGHEPPLILEAGGNVKELELQGGGLGFHDGFVYAEACTHLKAGDVVIMITDGITEARSKNGDFFDKEGVKRHLSKSRWRNLDSLAQGLVEAARTHADGNLQDDAAVVAVQVDSKPPRSS